MDADPDVLPRTDNFGLNYMAFVELCDEDTVPDFLRLAFNCCIVRTHSQTENNIAIDQDVLQILIDLVLYCSTSQKRVRYSQK